MKNELRGAAFFAVVALLFYLVGAFVFADFNLAAWPETGRVCVAVIGAFFSLLAYLLSTGKMS